MGRISPGPTRWPPGAEWRLVPAKSNLKPQTSVVVCFLGTRLHSCASLFLKIRNPKSQSTNLAGSLDGAPIITQSRRHKPCSKIEVSYSAHSQLAFDASLFFTDCQRDCDCDLRFARCCAAAVRSHNTTPPLRPRRGLTHLGGRHNVEYRAGPERKKNLGLDMCWLQKDNSGPFLVETVDQSWSKLTHRGAVMVHLSSAPHSHTVFDSGTAAALGGSCRRQPRQAHCTGAVPAARLWARRTITYHNIGHSYRSWMLSRPTGLHICQLERTYEGSRYH